MGSSSLETEVSSGRITKQGRLGDAGILDGILLENESDVGGVVERQIPRDRENCSVFRRKGV